MKEKPKKKKMEDYPNIPAMAFFYNQAIDDYEAFLPDEEEINEILKPFPSVAYPIFKINDVKYYCMNKEEIAQAIAKRLRGGDDES